MRSLAIHSKRALFHVRPRAFALAKPAVSMARGRSAFLAIASLTLATCSPFGDNRMIERGIGTDLYSSDVKEESRLLDEYLVQMCLQGGLGSIGSKNEPVCDPHKFDENSWTILVRAGFNDIDRRCDSYLAWLNSKRRTNNAVLSQLSQSSTATQSIMRIAGASGDPLAIVGLAFGLARDTFTNYYSRLLLEVESSTVELVVTENRHRFREAVNNTLVRYKPDAVHILRSYLLICTPHVIENNINTRTRFSVAGNIASPQDSFGTDVNNSTLSRSAMVRQTAPVKSTDTVTQQIRDRPEREVPGLEGTLIDKETLMKVQAYLCVESDGIYGQKTQDAVKIWEQNRQSSQTEAVLDGKLDGKEADAMANLQPCVDGLMNPYEREMVFANKLEGPDAKANLQSIIKSMMDKAKEINTVSAGSVELNISENTGLSDLRPEIAKLKKAMGLSETSPERIYLNMQITKEFDDAL